MSMSVTGCGAPSVPALSEAIGSLTGCVVSLLEADAKEESVSMVLSGESAIDWGSLGGGTAASVGAGVVGLRVGVAVGDLVARHAQRRRWWPSAGVVAQSATLGTAPPMQTPAANPLLWTYGDPQRTQLLLSSHGVLYRVHLTFDFA